MDDTDDDLDEALEQTFPASDPPANTVATGIRIHTEPPAPEGDAPPTPAPSAGTPAAP